MKVRDLILALAIVLIALPARAQMSEGEKKAAARAAYLEGVKLQDDGKPVEALSKFEIAQKLYDAPTHLLHIAECQALTGKLVEASETYETLTRKPLPPNSPDVFKEAQEQARAELGPLRSRIPTMKVNVRPEPRQMKNLQITVNERQMPAELVGIARPVNPGPYRVSAQAQGYATPQPTDVEVKEKEQKVVDLVLQPAASGPVYPVVVAPGPPPYVPGQPVTAPPPVYEQRPPPPPGIVPTPTGLLFGARVGYFAPGGRVMLGRSWETFTGSGPGFAADVAARLAKMMLIGGTLEFITFSEPKNYLEASSFPQNQRTHTATSVYAGLFLGIVPNIDKVSFIGDIGLGYRTVSRKLESGAFVKDESLGGVEGVLGVGISIPGGPIRVVPKFSFAAGTLSNAQCSANPPQACNARDATSGGGSISLSSSETHTLVSVQLAIYYSLDFGKKPAPGSAAPAGPAPAPPAPGNQTIQ